MKLPFVHIADVHLGRLQGRGLTAQQLARRRFDALSVFHSTLDAVAAQGIPLLFICGDLFEHEIVERAVMVEVCNRLGRLTGTHVFIVAGNHDYAAPDSYYRTLQWPANVHLFLDEWESVEIPALNVTVHGRGFTAPECVDACLRGFKVPAAGDSLQVVLLHADFTTRNGSSRYLPVSADDIRQCGADYVALGHIHAPQVVLQDHELVRAAYSGALEPLDFAETGDHGYYLGVLQCGGARLTFVPAAARRYHRVEVDVSGSETMEPVAALVDAALRDIASADLVRLTLQGAVHPELRVESERLLPLGERFFAFSVVDETTPAHDLRLLATGHSVRAAFVRRMMARLATAPPGEKPVVEQALRLGLAALRGEEVDRV